MEQNNVIDNNDTEVQYFEDAHRNKNKGKVGPFF